MSSFKPFAAACAALLTLALPSAASAASCPGADLQPNHGDFFAVADDATLCLLNEQRAAHGLSALRPGPESLAAPARLYAQDLVTRRFFAHVSPDGVTLAQRLAAYAVGSDWAIGENLAWGEAGLATPASIVDAWMKSPGHRANILNGEFKEIGIGVVPGAPKNDAYLGATYVTEFGVRAVDAQATVAPAQDAGARDVASTSGVRTTKKVKRAARCKRVVKKVRRNGRTVRVKRIVCPKRATSSRKKS